MDICGTNSNVTENNAETKVNFTKILVILVIRIYKNGPHSFIDDVHIRNEVCKTYSNCELSCSVLSERAFYCIDLSQHVESLTLDQIGRYDDPRNS